MPFGTKTDPAGLAVDFDAVYREIIRPAIQDVGLEPIRADEEVGGGIIHKPMFERLILCNYAIADLTMANANVFYELGIRHAVRPFSTVALFAEGTRLPFDIHMLRGLPYRLDKDGNPAAAPDARRLLSVRLRAALADAKRPVVDSPVYQLLDCLVKPDIDHAKTDVFRDRFLYSEEMKRKLTEARRLGTDAVEAMRSQMKPMADLESGVVLDLMLSFRAVKAWKSMIAWIESMPPELSQTPMVQEQLAFAFNRDGQGERAEEILLALLDSQGPSSETLGILGRVYKDRWEKSFQAGQTALAEGLLDKAVETYSKGFNADIRDAYPGINAVTLMELKSEKDPRQAAMLPVVEYAVRRRIEMGRPDYWDYATLLELAVLARDEGKAKKELAKALAKVREAWERETTVRNLRLIREARSRRGEDIAWAETLERDLSGSTGG